MYWTELAFQPLAFDCETGWMYCLLLASAWLADQTVHAACLRLAYSLSPLDVSEICLSYVHVDQSFEMGLDYWTAGFAKRT